jgi:hypothetical protein
MEKPVKSLIKILIEPNGNQTITPLVKSLSVKVNLPQNFKYKKEYKKHLSNKYTK